MSISLILLALMVAQEPVDADVLRPVNELLDAWRAADNGRAEGPYLTPISG